MLVSVKKAVLEITRQHDNGDITQLEAAQQLQGVLTVLRQLEGDVSQELKEVAKLQKKVVQFINTANRIY